MLINTTASHFAEYAGAVSGAKSVIRRVIYLLLFMLIKLRFKRKRMERRESTIERMAERVSSLCSNFDEYVKEFDRTGLFTGPSLYFHFRTLEKLRAHSSPVDALDDTQYLEYLYATLTAWGLHRMGPGGAKLVGFDTFEKSIREQKGLIKSIERMSLLELPRKDLEETENRLWRILDLIRVSESRTKLVANSKTLHHILPDLMPPIDREYTLAFFYGNKTISGKDEQMFSEIYPRFHEIALECGDSIRAHVGQGFHTSATKVIDNAIVGFVLKEIK